jgi:hypothetical protein
MFGWHRDNRLWISTSRRSASTATRLRRGGAGRGRGEGERGRGEGGTVDSNIWEKRRAKSGRGGEGIEGKMDSQ